MKVGDVSVLAPQKNKIPISGLRDFACQAVVLVYPTHGNSSQTLSAATWQEHVYRLTLACYCIGQKIFSLLRRLTQGETLIRTAEKKIFSSLWMNELHTFMVIEQEVISTQKIQKFISHRVVVCVVFIVLCKFLFQVKENSIGFSF